MSKNDIMIFIEKMNAYGDEWDFRSVQEVYGAVSLEAALAHRKASFKSLDDIMRKIMD